MQLVLELQILENCFRKPRSRAPGAFGSKHLRAMHIVSFGRPAAVPAATGARALEMRCTCDGYDVDVELCANGNTVEELQYCASCQHVTVAEGPRSRGGTSGSGNGIRATATGAADTALAIAACPGESDKAFVGGVTRCLAARQRTAQTRRLKIFIHSDISQVLSLGARSAFGPPRLLRIAAPSPSTAAATSHRHLPHAGVAVLSDGVRQRFGCRGA